MDNKTTIEQIYDYCQTHGSITVREAFMWLGINSPTKVISNMRRSGYIVNTEIEKKKDKQGRTRRWTRYYIKRRGADLSEREQN